MKRLYAFFLNVWRLRVRLLDENSITGQAFLALAENVVKQTEIRNAGQAPTRIVELKK